MCICAWIYFPVQTEMASGTYDEKAPDFYIHKETFEKKLLGLQKFEEQQSFPSLSRQVTTSVQYYITINICKV